MHNDLVGTTSGLVLLNKPAGQSSFAALRTLKAHYSGKVGHSGTLDPFATGLIIALCGPLTRLSIYFSALEKEYIATICFGKETTTLDSEGDVCATAGPPALHDLQQALEMFRGGYQQHPPRYSAVHIKGQRAYHLARQGVDFSLPARDVSISSLTLIFYDPPLAQIAVRCGAGTYLRALARDIAHTSCSVAHLSALCRTRIGCFNLHESASSDAVHIGRSLQNPLAICHTLPDAYPLFIADRYKRHILNGVSLHSAMLATGCDPIARVRFTDPRSSALFFLFNSQQQLLAICRREKCGYRYLVVVN